MILPESWRGLKTAIIGAAREGTALARYLAHCGARVILSDSRPTDALQGRLAAIEGLDIQLILGGNPPSLLDADVLFLSPGVPPTAPIVQEARARGVPLSSEPRLFTQSVAAPIVGVTGSSGKTTTTTLVGEMYAAQGSRTWVGGNIGAPLTERLLESERPDVAVMELSSFQLELFSPEYQGATVAERRSAASRVISVEGYSPHVAAVTNITPNHLDRHPSMEDYIQAKSHILAFQSPGDCAVLNWDDPVTRSLGARARGRVLYFSLEQPVAEGAYLQEGALLARLDGRESALCQFDEIKLRGRHNVANVLTAACCALAGGVGVEAIRRVATSFTGVPHRLEPVRVWRDVLFVNDSIATSPERAIAALRSYSEPLVLLAGGRDKHLPWEEWADLVLQRVRVVVAFGEAAPIIERALAEAHARRNGLVDSIVMCSAPTLDEAVAVAARLSRPGEVVLLSPGGTSFDAFEDFEARGRGFRELVMAL